MGNTTYQPVCIALGDVALWLCIIDNEVGDSLNEERAPSCFLDAEGIINLEEALGLFFHNLTVCVIGLAKLQYVGVANTTTIADFVENQ